YAPLLANVLIDTEDLVSTLSVGTSGAGRTALVNTAKLESAFGYQVGGVHRHIPEIRQNLAELTGSKIELTFTPILVPMFRGILAVNTARLGKGVTESMVDQAFREAYEDERFVEILPAGSVPDTKNVAKTNLCQISYLIDANSSRVTVVTALDNLVKGTAGAAIQSMNIALGLSEDCGL
ncbi:MAG: Asd/ArgC dimerization domain-containing protein, partial [Rhodoluna sp.]